MDKHLTMKQRLNPVAALVQAQIGDAFNFDKLALLFSRLEEINEMTPQLAEAQEYASYIPVQAVNNVVGSGEVLPRKRGSGKGKDYAGTGNDIPLAEVEYDHVIMPVRTGAIAYAYSILEVATAQKMGLNLENDKVQAARLAAEKHLSDTAWYGNIDAGLKGFINQDGVTVLTAQSDWKTAGIESVLGDINAALNTAKKNAEYEGGILPDTFLLPSNKMEILTTRIVPDSGGKTFMQFIQASNIFAAEGKTLTFKGIGRTNGKGTAEADRAIIYRRDPSCIVFKADDVQFLPAQQNNLDIKVPGYYKYQGVWLKRIDSMYYMDIPKGS